LLRRRIIGRSAVRRYQSSVDFGHSTFHSGREVEKRMSKGLYFDVFYTYAKAIDSQDGDNDGSGVAPIQNRRAGERRAPATTERIA